MKVLTAGHCYELENFEDIGNLQKIQFIEKIPEGDILKTVNDGTTNEEILSMLINRMEYLQGISPCRENAIVITKLQESLMWINKRTEDRVGRGVTGKYLV